MLSTVMFKIHTKPFAIVEIKYIIYYYHAMH